MTLNSGTVKEGLFHGGLLTGDGKEVDMMGGVIYEGTFKNGIFEAFHSFWRLNHILLGIWEGQGKLTYVRSKKTAIEQVRLF